MLLEQRAPTPDEDALLRLLLGARSLARRVARTLETAPAAVSGHRTDPEAPEVLALLGLVALGGRVEAWLAQSAAQPRALPPEPRPEPAAVGSWLR